jgi:DNA processing protein
LLSAFGLPEQIWMQSDARLREVLSAAQISALRKEPEGWAKLCAQAAQWLATDNRRGILTLADPQYPIELLNQSDPPLLLYWRGNLDLLQHPHRLAMVGSRNPSHQGAANAREFARALGQAGLCLVSGLALGIDGAAHEGALDVNAPTIAVVGTGLDRVYPAAHKDLAHRMAAQGLLLSEFPLGTPPAPANFPKRNRIIAGLSQGTLVVEATLVSGSLITARMAAEMGREVFAIPGSIHAPQAKGCHALIREGAKLVETAQDVLEELRLVPMAHPTHSLRRAVSSLVNQPMKTVPQTAKTAKVAETVTIEHEVLQHISHDPVSFDELQARTGWDTALLQAELLSLELDGHISRLPGGVFQRLVCA